MLSNGEDAAFEGTSHMLQSQVSDGVIATINVHWIFKNMNIKRKKILYLLDAIKNHVTFLSKTLKAYN